MKRDAGASSFIMGYCAQIPLVNDPIILLQLGLTNITDSEAMDTQLMESERKLLADDQTIRENVFSATTNHGRNGNKKKLTDEHDEQGRKKGFGGKCYN